MLSNLFSDLYVRFPDTLQTKAFFMLFGIVAVTIGYWLKQIVGAFIVFCIVLGLYLYTTGFFHRPF
ncbi:MULTISPECIES: hypothetical protein [Desulfococcus]|nr:hypothetical protein [Desulfococcus multivorans]AOY58746.1 uncharacterized protein Dmul_19730 [Desulfococcus multivorans]AQV01030.1 hypothetical protein B2D07_09790 [Desulfococcus multivorans]MDX9819133.1 hypothetical protein [Desulfococcus multivorans]